MPATITPITAGQSYNGKTTPPQPAVKPDDPEMMNFVDLDSLQVSQDELNRQKLAGKRREFLKTDLTWKQVLLDSSKKFEDPKTWRMLIGIAKTLGYNYICHEGTVHEIIQNPLYSAEPQEGHAQWIWADTGLVEEDINEIL